MKVIFHHPAFCHSIFGRKVSDCCSRRIQKTVPRQELRSSMKETTPKPFLLLIRLLSVLVVFLFPATLVLMAQEPEGTNEAGIAQAEAVVAGRFSRMRPYSGVSEAVYQARKAQALRMTLPVADTSESVVLPALAPRRAGAFTPTTIPNFDGIDQTCASLIPGDGAIAVSQFFGLQVENDCITVFNKNTGAPFTGYPKSSSRFFGLPPNNFTTGQFMTDPRLIFDWVSRKFVFIMLWEDFPNQRGFVMVAASANDDPRGSWFITQSQIGGGANGCPDFPTLGQNHGPDTANGAIAMGFNVFPCTTAGFSGALIDNPRLLLAESRAIHGGGLQLQLLRASQSLQRIG
jgi:hypothetical protein